MSFDAIARPPFLAYSDYSLELATHTAIGLRNAFVAFASTGQNLKNFEIVIGERNGNVEGLSSEGVISITLLAAMEPGKKGLGDGNRLGRSITYVISKKSGEIIREHFNK